MWKVNITMEDASELVSLLKCYMQGLPANEVSEREKVTDMKCRLEELITVVSEENKIVEDYLKQIKLSKGLSQDKIGETKIS